MKLKRIIASILALSLTLTTGAAVYAQNHEIGPNTETGEPDPNSVNTVVSFSVDPTYTVTIPKTVTLTKQTAGGYASTAEISASDVKIQSNQKIVVKIASDFTLDEIDSGETLSYTLKVGDAADAIKNGDEVASFTTDDTTASELNFAAEDPTYSGTYEDQVIFNIELETEKKVMS